MLRARASLRALWLIAATSLAAVPARASESCAPAGEWTVPGGTRIAAQDVLARSASAQVVLLGESHNDVDHHRWQLQTVSALSALHPRLELGFEMFPRRAQSALDRWVAHELSEAEFLKASDWSVVWGYDPALYTPLFHFARLNHVPMVALNVEREFVKAVASKGLAAVPAEKREGVSVPAPASAAYADRLFAAYAQHPDKLEAAPARTDPAFLRFVDAQLVWDRAMAQALAQAAQRDPGALVVGIMGAEHVANGEGVVRQLQSLGITRTVTLLPWNAAADCSRLSASLATAVFGIPEPRPEPQPQLLGIRVESAPNGVKVSEVAAGSIAAATGLREGDVLTEVAGTAVKEAGEVRAIVVRMAPGTLLPLKALRQGENIELTARFPAKR
jgi:uncharacterized iron-regulated protein